METKKKYLRIQSKIVKKWKEKYRLNGIEISYNRFGIPTWEMRSNNSRFVTYQGAASIKDITELEKNVELFKKEYPTIEKDKGKHHYKDGGIQYTKRSRAVQGRLFLFGLCRLGVI